MYTLIKPPGGRSNECVQFDLYLLLARQIKSVTQRPPYNQNCVSDFTPRSKLKVSISKLLTKSNLIVSFHIFNAETGDIIR